MSRIANTSAVFAVLVAMPGPIAAPAADQQEASRVYSYRLANCETRLIVDDLHGPAAPTWSPSGELFSVFYNDPQSPELRIYAASGELRKRVVVPQSHSNGIEWSPDERRIAYRGRLGEPDRQLIATDVVTGQSIHMAPLEPLGHWPFVWTGDSRRLLMMRRPGQASDSGATTIEELSLEKNVRVLRRSTVTAGPIDDSTVYELRGRAAYIITLGNPEREYHLIAFDAGYFSAPAFSRDRQWVAFRRNPLAANNSALTRLEVMRRDGSARVSIDLPFNAAPGEYNPQFLPTNKQVVVAEDARGTSAPGIYLVSLETRAVTRLVTASGWVRQQPQMSVSPDGQSLLYWSNTGPNTADADRPRSCRE